jgi:arsenate reductase
MTPPPADSSQQEPASPWLVDPDHALGRAAADLAGKFAGVFSPETVQRCVAESHHQLARTARIKTHLPVLAARFARERLTAIAKNQGVLVSDLPEVLFVCVHNAGRSQMAAALLEHGEKWSRPRPFGRLGAGRQRQHRGPRSDGRARSRPVSKEYPKPLIDEAVQAADVVITMGCGDACPIYPGKRYLDWELDDPAGKTIEQVRPIRDEIDRRVRSLLTELAPAQA